VAQQHPSRAVRIAAIDAYMWNHGDTAEAAAHIYSALPESDHKYVTRPRFYRGMNREVFPTRLREWREKWGPTEEKKPGE